MKKLLSALTTLLLLGSSVSAQLTPTNTFSTNQVILAASMNENFTDLGGDALDRTGGTITGNIAVDANITIDGVDISDYLATNVLAQDSGLAGDPSFSWVGDPDNGMFLSTTNAIGFATAGTEVVTIDASGNVSLVGGNLTLTSGASTSEFRINEPSGGGTSYTGFDAPALAGNVIYTLPTADGAASTYLQTDGSAALTWAAVTSPVSLLVADNGSNSTTSATCVDTVSLSGLTANDTLVVYYQSKAVTQAVTDVVLHNSTDTTDLASLAQASNISGGDIIQGMVIIRQEQAAATAIHSTVKGEKIGGADMDRAATDTFTTAWTGSWDLCYRHTGITSGGSHEWSWSVFKFAG